MARKKVKKRNCASQLYSVVKFYEKEMKLFECIWDGWFVDETRDACFWPPKTGKNYLMRVLSQEKPDDSWKIYQCEEISEGHVTYASGFEYVKEKCNQKFNTSSADDQHEALRYKRKHPVLASTKAESFEDLFKKGKVATKHKLEVNKQDKSLEHLSCKRNKGEKEVKCLRSETITRKDINRGDKKLSNHYEMKSICGLQSQDSSQHSRSGSVSLSNSSSVLPCLQATSNANTINRSLQTVSPRSHCSSKLRTSPISNRSYSSKPRSRSRSRQESIYSSRISRRSRSKSTRRSRSNSRSRSRSNSTRRSRSNSTRRSRSNSTRRSRSNSIRRSRSNSTRRSRSNPRSIYRSKSQRSTSSRRGSPQKSVNSKSRSRSNSGTNYRSNTQGHRSPTPTVPSPSSSLHYMQLQLKEIRAIVKQNHDRIAVNDRWLARMEVSVNKVLVTMTDLKQAINSNMPTVSNVPVAKSKEIPKGFNTPDLPMDTMKQLVKLNRNLSDGEFRVFLREQEKYYCTASRQSDTVVMTAYLKRFMSLELRDTLHLIDPKGADEPTLVHDFPHIYNFIIDVMITGYTESNNQLKPSDAHLALRTVCGRTKQMLREQK